MVAWWWVLIAFVVGEWTGIAVFRFLTMNEREPESKYIK